MRCPPPLPRLGRPRLPAYALLWLLTVTAWPAAAAPTDILSAHPAVRYEPKERCPEVRVSDEGDAVAVVFLVNPYGAPSQAHVRAPSQVPGLDAAAVSCVMKIRFQPATRPGDAQPVESWQQLWLRYSVVQGAAAPAAPALSAGGTAAAGLLAAGAGAAAHTGAASSVRVCTDTAGQLTQDPTVTRSSGDPVLDAAAVRIARSGAGNYRPAGAMALSGCAQLSVTFEAR